MSLLPCPPTPAARECRGLMILWRERGVERERKGGWKGGGEKRGGEGKGWREEETEWRERRRGGREKEGERIKRRDGKTTEVRNPPPSIK